MLQRPIKNFALIIATGLGTGYVPVAPGTAGSALALPFAWLLYHAWGTWGLIIGTLIITVLGIWAAQQAEAYFGTHDSSHIVVDEIAGQLLSLILVKVTWIHLIVAFGWFRLFDSVKPWPAGWIDRKLPGGLGVVLDDIAAGVYASLTMGLLVHAGIIDWVVQGTKAIILH